MRLTTWDSDSQTYLPWTRPEPTAITPRKFHRQPYPDSPQRHRCIELDHCAGEPANPNEHYTRATDDGNIPANDYSRAEHAT